MDTERIRFMTRDWDPAVAGIATDTGGNRRVVYDMGEVIEILVDSGVSPTSARDTVTSIFAETRAFDSAPLLFERMTPAEARASVFQGASDVRHTD